MRRLSEQEQSGRPSSMLDVSAYRSVPQSRSRAQPRLGPRDHQCLQCACPCLSPSAGTALPPAGTVTRRTAHVPVHVPTLSNTHKQQVSAGCTSGVRVQRLALKLFLNHVARSPDVYLAICASISCLVIPEHTSADTLGPGLCQRKQLPPTRLCPPPDRTSRNTASAAHVCAHSLGAHSLGTSP